jgi:hypothetical protein
MRVPLKLLIGPNTRFIENEHECKVTRVTDLDFDTLDTVTREVKVRSLRFWETTKFVNSISGVTGLLSLREQTSRRSEESKPAFSA